MTETTITFIVKTSAKIEQLNTKIKELSEIISYILTLDSMNEEIRPSLVFANKHLKYQNKRYKQKYYKSNTIPITTL